MNLIYQYFYAVEDIPEYVNLSRQSVKKYADFIQADYLFIDKPPIIHVGYGSFFPFIDRICFKYDKICKIDCDVLATKNYKNIFDESDNKMLSLNHISSGPLIENEITFNYPNPIWNNIGHGNAGIVVFPANIYNSLIRYIGDLSHHVINLPNYRSLRPRIGVYDQAILNLFSLEYGFFDLDYKFNHLMHRYRHDLRFDSTLIHYCKKYKDQIYSDFLSNKILK